MTYAEKLQRLKELDPCNTLLKLFESGQSAINAAMLDIQLKKLNQKPMVEPDVEEEDEDAEDPVLAGLYRDQSTLFGERRKLSNSFHQCETDGERRLVSQSIQAVQRRIEHVRSQIRAYKNTGLAPGAESDIPEDPFKLLSLQASLRSSISRKVRECKEYALNEDKRLPAAEDKLRSLKNHLDRVQKAIQDRNIQPG